MRVLTSTDGQGDLPRYFAKVFAQVRKLNVGQIEFRLADGRRFRASGQTPGLLAVLDIHHPEVFTRLIREGDLGFCEAYLEGWWSTPDLQTFMDVITNGNPEIYDGFDPLVVMRLYERLRHWLRGNSRGQARRNIARHYDLGNAFYQLWLDDSMTYSSALFRTGQESLERAQHQKYEVLLKSLDLKPGDHVLEIGCGWGGFAEYAATRRGARVTALTISKAQHDFAQERMRRAGLLDMVEIRLQDYRDERGQYDALASIEMFEAVGEKYWPAYFSAARDCLRPGGRGTIQVITVPESRFESYRSNVDFIQKYIFPGGMLISPARFWHEAESAGLKVPESHTFGESYSLTLRRWHENFQRQWDRIQELGYDTRFRRMWEMYLTSCAAVFRAGICDVSQITVQRPV